MNGKVPDQGWRLPALLRDWCAFGRGAIAGDFVVNDEMRVVYQAIPKVACTTWKNVMAHLAGIDVSNARMLHSRKSGGLNQVRRPSHRQIELWNRDYFTFTFIRNPWTRTLSAYLNKFAKDRESGSSRYFIDYARKHGIDSFETFIRHLEASKPGGMNAHWAPQSLLLNPRVIDFDFIGRFENMEADSVHVLGRLGIGGTLGGFSLSPHRTNADERISEYYTPERVDRVGRLFADDVQLGGYQPPEL